MGAEPAPNFMAGGMTKVHRDGKARRASAAARAKDLAPVIEAIRAEGITSATGIAKALNERGIPTSRGGKWQAVQVQRLERARRW